MKMAERTTLRIGLEYGSLLTHLVEPSKAQSGRLGDKGEALCGAFCSFVYGTWGAAGSTDREMICSHCEHMAGDDLAAARRSGRLF